jgi:hypothetical protein
MISKSKLKVEIKPDLKAAISNIAFSSGRLMFDWTPFEIPLGAASLVDISGTMNGTNGASQAGELFSLIFAKPINGQAPSSLGAINVAIDAADAVLSRKHIIGYHNIDMGEKADTTFDTMVSYNMFGANFASLTTPHRNLLVLSGDKLSTTTPGYQTVYVAGVAEAAFDFGTGVLASGAHSAGGLAVSVDGTDADNVFAPGDIIYAVNAVGTSTLTSDMEVVSTAADVINVEEGGTGRKTPSVPAITNDFEICHKFPVVLKLGLEY